MVKQQPIVQLPPVAQIGFVVKDVEKAAEYYSCTYGWGPFEVFEWDLNGFTYRGRTQNGRLKIAIAYSGPVQIELIQPLEGETSQAEFLRKKGEGIQHLSFTVDSVDRMVADLDAIGMEPVFRHSMSWLAHACYEAEPGGFLIELTEFRKRPQG